MIPPSRRECCQIRLAGQCSSTEPGECPHPVQPPARAADWDWSAKNQRPGPPAFPPTSEWCYKSTTPGSCTTRSSRSTRGGNVGRHCSSLASLPSDKSGLPEPQPSPCPVCRAGKNNPCRHDQCAWPDPALIHQRPGSDSVGESNDLSNCTRCPCRLTQHSQNYHWEVAWTSVS